MCLRAQNFTLERLPVTVCIDFIDFKTVNVYNL